jgi:prolyl 4-hydroxylase
LPGVSLPPPLAFNPRPRCLSTPTDAFELHPSSLGGDDYVDPDEPVAKESPSAPVAAAESEERFLSSARPLPKSVYARADQLVNVPGFPRSPPLVLSATRPKAYLFRNFLTEEECRHLIALAKAQLAPSTVVADGGKKSTKSGIRTSAGMFLTKGQTPTVRMVEERVAAAVGLPEENGEGMQILRYEHGQKYDPHYDYFHDKINPSPNRGGQRMATMLIYLKDTEEGGETIFPNAKKPEGFHDGEKDGAFSDCAKRGLPVKSKRGDAVLFWSLTSDYKLDKGSLHGACPVLRGEKWTAVKWIRVAKFDGRFTGELPMPSLTRGDRAAVDATARCVDEWDECAEWARKGWCERNPEFMTGVNGARDSKGPACAVSCGAPCPPLPPGSA